MTDELTEPERNLLARPALPVAQDFGVIGSFTTLEASMAPRKKKDALASVDFSDDLQKLRRDIGRLADQVSNSLQEAGDEALTEAKAQIGRIKDNVDGIIYSASEKGLNATKALREVTNNAGVAFEHSLRARPFATLAVAIGIGFIFGAAWRR